MNQTLAVHSCRPSFHIDGSGAQLTVQIGTSHKADMYAQVAVVGRAIQTQVDAEGHARPGGVFGAAVEADLVGLLALEPLKDGVRGCFGREGHGR